MSYDTFTDAMGQYMRSLRAMSPPEPPEDDPVERCEECGARLDDTAEVETECWRCGEAL